MRLTPAHRWVITALGTSITVYFWAWGPGVAGVIVTAGADIGSAAKAEETTTADLAASPIAATVEGHLAAVVDTAGAHPMPRQPDQAHLKLVAHVAAGLRLRLREVTAAHHAAGAEVDTKAVEAADIKAAANTGKYD